MTSLYTEIREYLRTACQNGLDAALAPSGFARRKDALVYSRKMPEAVQKIELSIQIHPADRPSAAAALYPWMRVSLPAVEKLMLAMAGGETALVDELVLAQPIELTSAKAAPGRWFIDQPGSVPTAIAGVQSFLERWTIPVLDLYSTPGGMCRLYDDSRERVETQVITSDLWIVAAMVLCGRTADAREVMEQCYGKPGPRERYQRLFDYLDGLVS